MHHHPIHRSLPVLLLLLLAWCPIAPATAQDWQADDHFQEIRPPVPTTGTLPEVVEVFNFKCSHCNQFSPVFQKWSHDNGQRYDIRSLPVFWGDQTDAPTRAYFAARFLGKGEEMKTRIFRAQFEEGLNIEEEETLVLLAEEVGLDAARFRDAMASFGVTAQVGLAKAKAKAYGVTGTPCVVVQGRYLVTGKHADGKWDRLLEIATGLAAR
ncbi:MAG: thiol:disulfide interchange protein DsbA/DsbL [Magnetococcales bacterium]|nr:thiol:disulfide interchange protein DsbA/DsbL [Magnetococcales bacterium]